MEKITLHTYDGQEFKVNPNILVECSIPGLKDWPSLPMGTTEGKTFQKVLEWCQHCFDNPKFNKKGLQQKVEKWRAWRVEKWELESKILDIDRDLLVKIMRAAIHFSIDSLLDASCERAARLLRNGSFGKVVELSPQTQAGIAKFLLPNALKRAVEERNIKISDSHMEHNRIWTSIFKNDAWFEAVLDLDDEVNPILIGKSLGESCQYLVLNSMDDFAHLKKKGHVRLKNSLHLHKFEEAIYECTMQESGNVLNIWQVMYWGKRSALPDLKRRLLQMGDDGSQFTYVSYLKHDKLYKHENKGARSERCFRLGTDHALWPYDGSSCQDVICIEGADVEQHPPEYILLDKFIYPDSDQGYS